MEPLKEMFNERYFRQLAEQFKRKYPSFKSDKFVNEVVNDLEPLSLNQRMRKASVLLRDFLPADYDKAISILKTVIVDCPRGYTNLIFPDFVGVHGKENFLVSIEALEFFTKYGSSEFAIREFLKIDFKRTIAVMEKWAKDANPHVRRLASEGSRPRLPWSFKLDEVIKDPALTRNILNSLKTDEELYVRKSVANHLNDLSKDHPDYMLKLVKSWDSQHPHTAWIIRHASRSLIKKGHSGSLSVFKYEKNPEVRLSPLRLPKKINLGDTLNFSFEIEGLKEKQQKLVVDYIIHYRKKNGSSPKVFKLKELSLAKNEKVKISKTQKMIDFTTRKHYPGKHTVEIQVNGTVMKAASFTLVNG